MISSVSGKIIHKFKEAVLVDVNKIGYKVFIPVNLWMDFKVGQEVNLFTYQCIRESSSDLYGFLNPDELVFFELLMTISGIGPKSALGILSVASLKDLKRAIITGDASILTVVSGIGNKTAQRIILELKNKIEKEGMVDESSKANPADQEVIDGLVNLGYSYRQAREAVNNVSEKIKDISQRLKESLKYLAKKNNTL